MKGGETMPSGDEELVQVMVPREHLAEIYKRLGELSSNGGPVVESEEFEEEDDPGRAWSDRLLRRAWADSDTNLRAVLKYLAKHPGERVPSEDLIALLRKQTNQPNADHYILAGTVGAFGRRVKNRYGLKDARGRAILPFRHPWDRDLGSRAYIMPSRIARTITQL